MDGFDSLYIRCMIIVLNGPLGIGKTTLAEAPTERIAQMLMRLGL